MKFLKRLIAAVPVAIERAAGRLAAAVVATAAALSLVSGLGIPVAGLGWVIGGVAVATLLYPDLSLMLTM